MSEPGPLSDVRLIHDVLNANGYPDPDDTAETCPVAALHRLRAALLAEQQKNERLSEAILHVVRDSPGTPATVKGYLRAALAESPRAT